MIGRQDKSQFASDAVAVPDSDSVVSLLPPRADKPCEVPSTKSADVGRESKSKRNRWSFRLRSLVLVQLALVLFLGYIGQRIHSFREQQAVIAQFANRERCYFTPATARPEWFWSPVCRLAQTEPGDIVRVWIGDAPLSLREAHGFHRFSQLRELSLQRGIAEPAASRALAQLSALKRLDVRDAERKHLNDETLAALAASTSIKHLTIQSVNVTDDGIGRLAAIPNLEYLDIHYAKMSFAGLRPWIAKNRLPHLSLLVRIRLSDEELLELSQFTSLRSLSMYELRTEEGVLNLAKLPNLRSLNINGNFPMGIRWYASETLPNKVQIRLEGDLLRRTHPYMRAKYWTP